MTRQEIVPAAEVECVHANANFGGMSKRGVVDDGVLKYAFRFHCGFTQMQILKEHGLIRSKYETPHRGKLTAKGKRYLHALGADVLDALKSLSYRI